MLSRLSSILHSLQSTLSSSASAFFQEEAFEFEFDHVKRLLRTLVSSYYFAQLFPFLVLFGLPALALAGYSRGPAAARVLGDMLGVLSYLWGGSAEASAAAAAAGDGKTRRRRARAGEKEVGNGFAAHGETTATDDDLELRYPGLVNVSGTYCFLNSILQAMASLAYLQPHIEAIHARAVDLDVPTPVVDTLIDTLKSLNTPKSYPSSFRPVPMINALSQPAGSQGRSRLFASREHQDAQELFQLLSEFLKNEALAVDAEAQRDRGLGAFASFAASSSSAGSSSSVDEDEDEDDDEELGSAGVFDGLTANRRSCVTCGYTEAVMHFACATWQLALPMGDIGGGGEIPLQSCLEEYTRLEVLTDCLCRRCSLRATQLRLRREADELWKAPKENGSAVAGAVLRHVNGTAVGAGGQSKKKRRGKEKAKETPIDNGAKIHELEEQERMVAKAIDEGRIEQDLPGITMERVFSRASTKQAMVARPPKVLVLHLNRSVAYGSHTVRNSTHVRFPEILDLTPYTTSGILSTAPQTPISPPPPALPPRCATPTQSIYAVPRVLYRLSAVVAHYGAHSYGHYVCFRRRPRVVDVDVDERDEDGEGEGRAQPAMPTLACPMGCECVQCTAYGPIRDAFTTTAAASSTSTSTSTSDTVSGPSSRPKNGGGSSSSAKRRQQTVVRGPARGRNAWLRISDDRVEECALERVLAEGAGAFLLFYERVQSGLGLGAGHGHGVGVGVLGSSAPAGVGFGRALGKVYSNGGYARGTPRSSEETVRPDEVGASTSVDSFTLHTAGEATATARTKTKAKTNGDADPKLKLRSQSPVLVPVPVAVPRPRVVRRTTAGRRKRTVVPSSAVTAAAAVGLGSGASASLEGANTAGGGGGGGAGGLEMATSAPDLRDIPGGRGVGVGPAEERMAMSEMAEEGEGQARFQTMMGFGSGPGEGTAIEMNEDLGESVVRVERPAATGSSDNAASGVEGSEPVSSQSFRDDSVGAHTSSSSSSPSSPPPLPFRDHSSSSPPSLNSLLPPSSPSPRSSSPSTSSSSSSSSSPTHTRHLRTSHHSHSHGHGHPHTHNAAAPLGLRA